MVTLAAAPPPPQTLKQILAGTWTDRLLLLLALAGIVSSWFAIHALIASGPPTVYIYHGDTLLATYPLPHDNETIHFDAGGELGTSEVVIDRHGARIVSSPCTTKLCVLSGIHKHAGDMIACVPNHILVSIRGSGENRSGLDAVVE